MEVSGFNIKKISGPVNCYYLKPNEIKFREFHRNNIDLPLLLLFGDIHGLNSGMCLSCSKRQGCYNIYDKELLILLDSLSTKDNPIDFYVETFMDYEYQRLYNITLPESQFSSVFNTPMNKLIYGDMEICFKRNEKGTLDYESKCPTNNIRWHYSDPRKYYKYIEGNITLLSMYLSYIDKYVLLDYEMNVRYERDNLTIALSYFKNIGSIDDIKHFLYSIDFDTFDNSRRVNPSDILNIPNSIVRKQLEKHINTGIDWRRIYIDSIQYLKPFYESIEDINNLIDNIDDYSYLVKYRLSYPDSFNSFLYVIDEILSKLVDLYFIARFLKGDYRTQPSLVISYLGVFHTENIVNILVNVLGLYDVSYKVGTIGSLNYPNRCLEFIGGVHENINLDTDIYKHNMNRSRDI